MSESTRSVRTGSVFRPASPVAPLLQRKCACGGTPGPSGECAECRKKRLQRKEANPIAPGPGLAPPIVHDVLRSPGRPLEPEIRSSMENRFGHDFGQVRVHADAKAAESARAVGALAYTVGSHVAFEHGRYAPGSAQGDGLLAHELAHVVQQGAMTASASAPLPISPVDHSTESQADRAAAAALLGGAPDPGRVRETGSTAGLRLQRAPAKVKGCDADREAKLLEAHQMGIAMVGRAATATGGSAETVTEPLTTLGRRWFKLEPPAEPAMLDLWNHVFRGVASLAEGADATRYRCGWRTDQLAISWPGRMSVLQPLFDLPDAEQRAAVLIHEWGHMCGRGIRRLFERYCGREKFAAYPAEKLVQMPDAYMGFIFELSERKELPSGLCMRDVPDAPGGELPADLFGP